MLYYTQAPGRDAKAELSSTDHIKQQQMHSQVGEAMDRWKYLRVTLIQQLLQEVHQGLVSTFYMKIITIALSGS